MRAFDCGHAAKVNDAQVFRESRFKSALVSNDPLTVWPPAEERFVFEYEGVKIRPYVVADAAYPLMRRVVTPYEGTLTEDQRTFNFVHSSNRMVVEHVMGRVKGRFRQLASKMRVKDDINLVDIIGACFILHNLCLDGNDDGSDLEMEEGAEENSEEDTVPSTPLSDAAERSYGTSLRLFLQHYVASLKAAGRLSL